MRPASYSSAKTWKSGRQSPADERGGRIDDVFTATKGLLSRSNHLIHMSHNVTVNSKSTAERTLAALNVAHKQLERTKQCMDSEALTPKSLRRASASIIQRVGRSEPCIDAFQRIFPPEEIGGAIVWSPDASSRNLRTALPYKIRYQSRVYDHSVKQVSSGSPSRTSVQFYDAYASRVPPRLVASPNRQLTNLHQNMAQKAVLDHVEINRSLIGHLVEAKEEVRRDLSHRGDYCDYYAAQETAGNDYALICNPVRRLDQLDHVVNNITNDDVLSFINDENANAIFQNAVVAESAKALSPMRRQTYSRSSVDNRISNSRRQSITLGTTPPLTSRHSSFSIDRTATPPSATYFTRKGRTKVFADSLARASELPKRKLHPTDHDIDEHAPHLGASQMLLSAVAECSGNPLDDAFQLRSNVEGRLDPELLAFNYAAQHVKTAAEKYYSIPSSFSVHVKEGQSQLSIPTQQSHIAQSEALPSDNAAEEDLTTCQDLNDDSNSSTEGFQIVPSKSMDIIALTSTPLNTESPLSDRRLNQQPKSADSLVTPSNRSTQKRSSAKQQGKSAQVQREGEKTKRTMKPVKKRPTTKQQKISREVGTRQRKTALAQPQQQAPVTSEPHKDRDPEESVTSITEYQKITVLAKDNSKSPVERRTPVSQQEKKTALVPSLNISNATGIGTSRKTPKKKNTSLLEEMANNNVISQPRHSLEMRIAQTAAKELLLPSTFSLSSTPGSSPAASRVVKAALTPPLPSPGVKRVHETPESMRLSIITQTLSPPGQTDESSLYPVKISSLDAKTESIKRMLIAQKNLANKTAESISTSQSSSVADRMRALTPDQRKHRLNSILENRGSTTRASIDSINRLSLDMQIRGSVDAQHSDYTDTRKETSVLSDQDSLFPCSRRGSISRSRHITERLNAAIGAREERRSLDKFVDETEDVAIQDVFVQRDQILRTLKLDAKTRKTLRKIRAFLLLTLVGNALMSMTADHTPRGSPRNKRYNFKQMYNRHRNLTHALDYDANIPAMKVRK